MRNAWLLVLLLLAPGARAATCDDLGATAASLEELAGSVESSRDAALSENQIDLLEQSARDLDRAASEFSADPHVGQEAKQLAEALAEASRELNASLPIREHGRIATAYDGVVKRLGELERWCDQRSLAGFRTTPGPPPVLTGKGATRGGRKRSTAPRPQLAWSLAERRDGDGEPRTEIGLRVNGGVVRVGAARDVVELERSRWPAHEIPATALLACGGRGDAGDDTWYAVREGDAIVVMGRTLAETQRTAPYGRRVVIPLDGSP